MRNKQPFYHRVDGLLFTATRPISEKEFMQAVKKSLALLGVIVSSIELDGPWEESEPGSPDDLL